MPSFFVLFPQFCEELINLKSSQEICEEFEKIKNDEYFDQKQC